MREKTAEQLYLQELQSTVAAYDRDKARERASKIIAQRAGSKPLTGDTNELVQQLLGEGPDEVEATTLESVVEGRGGIYITSAALTGWPTSAEMTPEAASVVAEMRASDTIMIIDTPDSLHHMFGGHCDAMVQRLVDWHTALKEQGDDVGNRDETP